MIRRIPVQVVCYAGYKADETPRGFTLGDRRYDIEEIVDRWYQASRDSREPAADCYRVRTVEGSLFVIQRSRASATWYLVEEIRE
jgi:hypothetical protein